MAKITKVAVSFGESIAHPRREVDPARFSHSQMRPSLFLEAELEEGEDYVDVRDRLFAECKEFTRSEIVNAIEKVRKEKEDGKK